MIILSMRRETRVRGKPGPGQGHLDPFSLFCPKIQNQEARRLESKSSPTRPFWRRVILI